MNDEQLGDLWRAAELYARFLGAGDSSQDIAQEVVTRFWQTDERASIASPEAWIKKAVRNRVIDDWRKRRTEGYNVPVEEATLSIGTATAEDDILIGEQRGWVARAVRSLPSQQGNDVRKRYWDGMKPTDIAAATGRSSGAVRQSILKALRSIRAWHQLKGAVR